MVGLYKFLLVILVLPAHWIAESKKMGLVLTKIESKNYMPSLITNLRCVLKSNQLGQSAIDMDFLLASDVYNVSVSFSVKVMREKLTMNYTKIRMDFGAGLGALQNHFATRIIANELRRSSNIPFGYPFEKNKPYYLRDFRVNADLLPKYSPELNFTSTADFYTSSNQGKAMRVIVSGGVVKLVG